MARFWKSKAFQELKEEWDEKLKETGFEDAEKEVDGKTVLKRSSYFISSRGKSRDNMKEAEREYCQLLEYLVSREENFEDRLDKIIMERTAEGKSIREISDELKDQPKIKLKNKMGNKSDRNTIAYVRRRYENKWGIKYWKPEQMVSRKTKPTR